MKNKINLYSALLMIFFVLVFSSCEKSEIITIDENYGGIAFFTASGSTEADSLSYSFAYNTTELERDTIFIDMRLTGEIKSYDREIGVTAAEGTTAVQGVNFELPKVMLPAGEYAVKYPLVLFNTPDLTTKDFRIVLKVIETKDLKIGALGREIGTTVIANGGIRNSSTTINMDKYVVNFNNKLTEPDYWAGLEASGYGTFSITKFQFMLKTLGTEKMELAAQWNYNQTLSYLVQMQNALQAYEQQNGEMIDENGQPVLFE
ncbi:DUF4843 domain-containing protein [Flavobacterium luteolum]|uniref:DUF4843 domain-containing protein n=1 Tax=Flavobacterium luteolum TaxID=3003259 RepID=UPI00248DCA73|nr:DUF4843 domain-containing protein [Flavobacterium luteolum]